MHKQLIINNLLISYFEDSVAEGSTLLFLHGWRSSKEVWAGTVAGLVTDGGLNIKDLYTLDLPGFGGSQLPAGQWHVADYASVAEEFIKKLELKNVVLIGHSFGGRVGIKLASARPGLLSKLVLVDSAAFPAPKLKKKLFAAVSKIVKPLFTPAFMQGARKKIYQKIGAEDYVATPELQKTFVNVINEDLTEDLKKINIPTLIMYGAKDSDTPLAYGEKMHSLIQNSQLFILKNAGHYSFLDAPKEFVEKLKDFIQT